LIGSTGTGGTGGSGLLGLGSSAVNFFGNSGINNPFVSSTDYMNNIGAVGSGMFDQSMSSADYLNDLYGGFDFGSIF
jgi:subtilase family serine protease